MRASVFTVIGSSLLLASACSSDSDDASSEAPAAIQESLRFFVDNFPSLTNGLQRFINAGEGNGTTTGVALSDAGFGVSGTVSLDLTDDGTPFQTDAPVTTSGSLPLDFTAGVLVSLTGPSGSRGVPVASGSATITRNENASLGVALFTSELTSDEGGFSMLIFESQLTLDSDLVGITGQVGYEILPDGGGDISFGTMVFRTTSSGIAVDVSEDEGAYAFTVD